MAMMNPINALVMQEVGLTTKNNVVIDEETRAPIIIKDKQLKYSSQHCVPVKRQECIFDPADNKVQMSQIFDYFILKLRSEGHDTDMYYDIHNGSALEVRIDGERLQTSDYNNEQLKFVDMMMQLNGSSPNDVKSLDDKKKSTKISRKPKLDFER